MRYLTHNKKTPLPKSSTQQWQGIGLLLVTKMLTPAYNNNNNVIGIY